MNPPYDELNDDELNVLIVSFRRPDLLTQCLSSVSEHLPRARVLVWDNHSSDSDAIKDLAEGFANVDWVFSPTNVGFAAAVNRLVEQTTAGNLLLLNPDARLVSDLSGCRHLLDRGEVLGYPIAAVAPMISDAAGGRSWDNARRVPGVGRWVVSSWGYGRRLRALPVSDLYPGPPARPVGYLSGACLLVSRKAWQEVGPLDEGFFLYAEEADWAQRARQDGWIELLVREEGAIHGAKGSVADDAELGSASDRLLRRSQSIYLSKHQGSWAERLFRASSGLHSRYQRLRGRGPV